MSDNLIISPQEARREIYRVMIPGAENDLYSLLELREMALRKIISPRTIIRREGDNFQVTADSIPTVFSTRESGMATFLAIFLPGIDQFYLGKIDIGIWKMLSAIPLFPFLIWWVYDIYRVTTGKMRDRDGRPLR